MKPIALMFCAVLMGCQSESDCATQLQQSHTMSYGISNINGQAYAQLYLRVDTPEQYVFYRLNERGREAIANGAHATRLGYEDGVQVVIDRYCADNDLSAEQIGRCMNLAKSLPHTHDYYGHPVEETP